MTHAARAGCMPTWEERLGEETIMTLCPDCGHQNMDGADVCEACESSLTALSEPRPRSELERRVTEDAVGDLAPREPVVVAPETPVGEVLRRLVARNAGCAVVVQDRALVGIFTDRDALFRLNVDGPQQMDRPVAELMSSPVETLQLDDRIAFALHKMEMGGYRHLPILDQGRVAGMLSVRNVLDYLTAALGNGPVGPCRM